MSKKYFAEYIPVKGEIKEGDSVLMKTGHGEKVVICKNKEQADLWNSLTPKQNVVKLCLCSRDIKIGDKIKDENFPEQDAFYMDGLFLSMLERRNIKDQFYKVIGKISPDAIWVTRGMEFDEDNVCIMATDKHFGISNPIEVVKKEDIGEIWVEIKCPTCKTFH